MARNRKRAKERRPRRPAQAADSRQGIPTATHEFEEPETHELEDRVEENGAPDPLEHATPDVELAEEQLAFGRPEEPEPEDEADEEEFELEVEESIAADGRRGRRRGGYDDGGGVSASGSGAELAAHGAVHPERRLSLISRLIGFLQGSWRELQRVQWPDRRQVMQATAVVLGFVFVAAVFLGVADELAGKLVNLILK